MRFSPIFSCPMSHGLCMTHHCWILSANQHPGTIFFLLLLLIKIRTKTLLDVFNLSSKAILSSAVGPAFRCVILREHLTKIKWCVNALEVRSKKKCRSAGALLKTAASNISANASALQIEKAQMYVRSWQQRGTDKGCGYWKTTTFSCFYSSTCHGVTDLAASSKTSMNFCYSIVISNSLIFCFLFFRGLWMLWGTQAQVQETGWQHLPGGSRGGSRELQPSSSIVFWKWCCVD